MLIDGQKWACEACIRGHRVTSCKHHDRPLIRIKRKGRPFATCSICHSTPCESPTEHARQKRETELKHPSKKATHARLYPRHHNPNGFQPIAPRPSLSSKKSKPSESSSAQVSRSGSTSAASSSHTPAGEQTPSYRRSSAVGAGYWSGSEGSGNESTTRTLSAGLLSTASCSSIGVSDGRNHDNLSRPAADICPSDLDLDPVVTGDMFDPLYSLLPTSSSSVSAAYAQAPLISPLESANPFDFPLDPALGVDRGPLGYLEDMDVDVTEGLVEELFHVEDWSRYMWSPETGFEHLDMGYPPVTR